MILFKKQNGQCVDKFLISLFNTFVIVRKFDEAATGIFFPVDIVLAK